MKLKNIILTATLSMSFMAMAQKPEQQYNFTIDISKPVASVNPAMYGIFLKTSILLPTEGCMPN